MIHIYSYQHQTCIIISGQLFSKNECSITTSHVIDDDLNASGSSIPLNNVVTVAVNNELRK